MSTSEVVGSSSGSSVDTVTIRSIEENESLAAPHNSSLPLVELEPRSIENKSQNVTSSTTSRPTDEPQPSTSTSSSSLDDPTVTAGSSKQDGAKEKPEKEKSDEEKKDDSMFECNICLDTAKDAVVSMCGHLFCWACLHQWLETNTRRQLCPVCKAAISKEKVIPLYGRGSTNQADPRKKVPPRPAGQRTEPEPATGFNGFGLMDGGFHMSFGIGAFPLGYLSSTFNYDGWRGNRGRPG